MPQTATNQNNTPDGDYTAVDPRQNPLAWAYQNKDALARMPEDKAVKFVDMLFKRYALPKLQKGNRPPTEEELEDLRLQFHARMYGLPTDKINLKEERQKYGSLEKSAATLEGAGAGVLGGVKTIAEFYKKIQDHLGPIGKPAGWVAGKVAEGAGRAEGKAYEDASLVSPGGASAGAMVGHQIPSTIATGGAGKVMSGIKGATTLGKMAVGAAKGIIEGETWAKSTPGADAKNATVWGGVLGAAFPFLGKLFGLGRGMARKAPGVVKEAEAIGTGSTSSASKTTSFGAGVEEAAKAKFGKSFKDLTPKEKTELPRYLREQAMQKQEAAKATAKAEKAAAKAASDTARAAERAEKAKQASEKAAKQAEKRNATASATAAQAATENPNIAKVMSGFKEGEGTAANAPGQTIKTNASQELESAKHEFEKAKSILKNPNASEEEKKIAKDNYKFWKEKLEGLEKPKVTKVAEGVEGKKVRAKEGKPASPAQQKADADRIAAKRAEAKQETFGSALEKHAQQMAGKYTSATQVGVEHIPELEDTVREMEGGLIISGLQKLRKQGKLTDELYAQHLKDWILTQFEKAPN